jgi:hypothetical protein
MAQSVSKKWVRQAGLFTIQEAAYSLGVDHRQVRYDIRRGWVFRPSTHIGSKRRCYEEQLRLAA